MAMSHTTTGTRSAQSASTKPEREMKVLALGLLRTGTASMAQALATLGYQNVYHGLRNVDNDNDFVVLSRAADATFPNLPTYTGQAFTREQWDEIYGASEAITDLASMFAPALIKAYPEAKVLLVIRDCEAWFRSFEEGIVQQLWGTWMGPFSRCVEPLLGVYNDRAGRKILLGFFNAHTVEEIRAHAREAYDRHSRVIHEMVPADNLLVYRMGEGWAPLCRFLGKPVPDTEFPWINELAALQKAYRDKRFRNTKAAVMLLLPWVVGATALGIGLWMVVKRSGDFDYLVGPRKYIGQM